ncbi:GTP pyrophosphokinase [Corynebacterium auriscanis]|uniref:GTP pyrophosphokinase n=1 Tax=Corynebacterium auriscanis TaxID=99807 RepID=UPI003CF38C79
MSQRNDDSTLAAYDSWRLNNPYAANKLREKVMDALDDAGLAFDQVAVRVKDRDSFAAKLRNSAYPEYVDLDSAYDILGVRVIAYHSSEIPQLKQALGEVFTIEQEVDKAAETARAGRFGYASQHLIARDGNSLVEIQLRTVLQHAWAEFEHDIRYKNHVNDPEVDRAFTLAAGLIELADEQFDKIAEFMESGVQTDTKGEEDKITADTLPRELTLIAGDKYPTSRVEYYNYAVDMLHAHGITTYKQLRALMRNLDKLQAAMNYPYRPGQVRLIDDMLLYTFGRDHIRKTVHIGENAGSRPGRLGSRWQKLDQKTLLGNSIGAQDKKPQN